MGLFDYLGLDDLADDIREFTNGIDGLKEDLINSVMGSGEEFKQTVDDIAEEIKPGDANKS